MAITLNGNLGDWTAADRLETPSTLTAGYELYGRFEAGTFFFALRSAVAIGPNTTIWLNTDGNVATGKQAFNPANPDVGAEYYVNIDSNNVAQLYTSADVLVGPLTSSWGDNFKILELAIPQASVGGVSALTLFADVNDTEFLHNPYTSGGFVISDPAVQPFDGNLTEWTSAQRLDGAGQLPAGYELYGKVENSEFVFGLKSATVIGSGTTFWLNTDGNAFTGHQIFDQPGVGGAEYNVNIGADGVARLYTGNAGETFVANIDYKIAFDGLSIEFSVPKATLGGTPTVTVLADISDTNVFLPGSYSDGGFTLIDNSVNPYDGVLTEWTHADRLETPLTTVAGIELYGKYEAGSFVFAVKSSVAIGPNTTFWFNTDGNASTGEPTFGGAEYHVNIDAQGVARLYAGPNEATPLGTINFAFGADHKTLEFAIPKTLIGQNVEAVTMLGDLNQSIFFPAAYPATGNPGPYTVIDPASLPPTDHAEHKIAIVYSESSAALYFGGTSVNAFGPMAYSQLFMTAQSQAMAAGVPYDIVSEADLKDLTKMAAYDTIVFPSFTNVKAADVAAIQDVLTKLVYQYDVSLIAAGNFMTTDENGNVLADAPARMQSLFGIEGDGFASGQTVDLKAHGLNPITAGYGGDGAAIHSYAAGGTSFFKALSGVTTTVIADQVVNGVSHAAVIGTETGSRNVHFATEGFLGDNNLLGQAIDWVNEEAGGPTASLEMTRSASIVAARIDMDQAQETFDVDGGDNGHIPGAGIYDKLLPILDQWKAQYNFVGSYYIDIGNNPPDQETDWVLSKAYYDQMVAAGNEIGSHSYTHPENTNFLAGLNLTDAQLQAIKDSGPVGLDGQPTGEKYFPGLSTVTSASAYLSRLTTLLAAPNNWTTLGVEDKAILESSFQFQFEIAKQIIEQHMGPISGAAVPGAPETLETARQIMQYYDYISGGAALVGAGYPGAFGYLSPDDASKVYIAPNMSFDFTLRDFQHLTLEQTAAKWAAEFSSLNVNSDVPIVVWPWHDYAPTEWPLDEGATSSYTRGLFDQFIQTAYNSGAEFVTLADLAARIKAFEQSSFGFTVAGDTITMHAVPQTGTLGTFALNLDDLGGKVIQSVTNWYAYDDNSVFLDADGGSFVATLGSTQTDVTHITSIGARAQLTDLTGDGTNLTATIVGEGRITIDLSNPQLKQYSITGATQVSMVGDVLTLDLGGIGTHTVVLQQVGTTAPTIADFGPAAGGWVSSETYPRQVMDVNGDGKADIIGFGDTGVIVALADGAGGFNAPNFALHDFAVNAGGWLSNDRHPRQMVDVNGDGKADIVGFGDAGVIVATANGSGGFNAPNYVIHDFAVAAGGWVSGNTHPRQVVDVNGDGHTDIVGFGDAGVIVALNDGNGGFGAPNYVVRDFGYMAGGWTDNNAHPRTIVDVNGDGKADIVGFGDAGVIVALANSSGGFAAPIYGIMDFAYQAGGWTDNNAAPRQMADVDGDGRADIVAFTTNGVYVALASSDAQFHFNAPTFHAVAFGPSSNGWTNADQSLRLATDVDGDHKADLVAFADDGVHIISNHDWFLV